jgi:hypothetical protein
MFTERPEGFAKKVDNTVYHSPFDQTSLGQNEDIVHKQEMKDFCQPGDPNPCNKPFLQVVL